MFCWPIWKAYVPYILYNYSSSEVVHDDPPCHSSAPRGNPWADAGAIHVSIDSDYTLGYVSIDSDYTSD